MPSASICREEKEPQIYHAIRFGCGAGKCRARPSAPASRIIDDIRYTENTRAAYPVEFIENASLPGIGGHPKNVLFLTADAFGVLPPIAKLTPEQAMYHFLSGYTAKLAGTEAGLGIGAGAGFLHLLRVAVSAAAAESLCGDAGRAPAPTRSAMLAGQHRLDRRCRSASAGA